MLIANTKGNEYMLLREDSTWLNRIVTWNGGIQSIMRYRWKYDETMNVLSDTNWTDIRKYDPRERPWFTGGLNTNNRELAWTQPYIFFTTKDPGITVSVNWKASADVSLRYVIAFDILLIDISDYTSKLNISKNGKAFILTSDSKIIGLPRDHRFENPDSLKKFVLYEYKDLNISELTEAVNKWKTGDNSGLPFSFELDGNTWWAGIHPFELGKNNLFYIGVVVPEDDFMSEVNRTRTVIVAAFLLVLVLTLLVIRGYNRTRRAYALLEKQNQKILEQKDEISSQRDKIEIQRNEITDSIKYSKRIQTAVLPPDNLIKSMLPSSFVFFRPKDIISGDFYWVERAHNKILWASVDCTGHGVPGAIMSIIGFNGLNRAVREYHLLHPGEILDRLNHIVAETFRQDSGNEEEIASGEVRIRDGMDISLCSVDYSVMEVEFAAANNSMFLVRGKNVPLIVNGSAVEPDLTDGTNTLYEVDADKQPIGSYSGSSNFTTRTINIIPGDSIYTTSDGFADQFGGPKGKKYMKKQMKALFLDIQGLNIIERNNRIDEIFNSWKGSHEQVDDVLIFAVQIQAVNLP
ncbi:MAG: SpoIIE family protein phosphatase [Bacteroidetes bacterium]|nr:SpoIIE family protein phosphatase [Bacteroidota bacterium]